MSETPSAIKLYKGLSIYRVAKSRFWYVRIWDRTRKKYLVKSTGEDTVIRARMVAQELALSLLRSERVTDTQYQIKTYAIKMLNKSKVQAADGERSIGYMKSIHWAIQNEDWGLVKWFGPKDVRKLRTHDFQEYFAELDRRRPDLSSSTKNTLMAAFRNVLKIARDEGVIEVIPATPRARQKDNPRPFFRFHPLVSKEEDVYKKLLNTAQAMSNEMVEVRGITVTDELYDLLLFVVHSFVRPITTELYALKHKDVTVADDPKRLILTVRNGKTGYRSSNTMPGAVAIYKRICDRSPERTPEDYLFLPEYANRTTASKITQRQFHALLDRANIQHDAVTGKKHTLYSLRHTAICMRLILSHGKVNIFNLAKNAGTSVDQIERFYAKHLPLSREMAINLQSFGGQD